MKIKLLTFDKHFESPEAFEQRASKIVAELGEITDLDVQFVDGIVFFKFEYSDKPAEQEFYILSWLDKGNAEGVLSNSVTQIESNGKSVLSVDLTFYSTKRVLASILVKVDRHNDISNNEQAEASSESAIEAPSSQDQGQEPSGEQNKDLDVKPDAGPKRRRKPTNRGSTDG